MNVRLRAFPSQDAEFARYAEEALAGLGTDPTPEGLQRALRARYPAAIVRVQDEFARHGPGPVVWYVLRTGGLGSGSAADRREPDGWAIVDDDRRFVAVSPSLSGIVELPARHLVGRRIEDFSSADDPTIREDILELWNEFVRAGSIESTVRFNFADGRPRELAYRVTADADGPGRHRLDVWVVTAPA